MSVWTDPSWKDTPGQHDDTRVLLYSLTHGGYAQEAKPVQIRVGDTRRDIHHGPLSGAIQLKPEDAEFYIKHFAHDRLVIADIDGWIQHDGGGCPVAPDFRVDIRVRLGAEKRGCAAKTQVWGWHSGDTGSFDITAWRPAQEERDEQTKVADSERGVRDCLSARDAGEGGARRVAGPVTPDAAGVSGVRERLEALRDDLRREADRDFTDPCARGGATMAGSVVADLDAILAALPEGELIDAGKWEFAHDDFGQLYACPVDGVEPQGVRVFVQRKEVG